MSAHNHPRASRRGADRKATRVTDLQYGVQRASWLLPPSKSGLAATRNSRGRKEAPGPIANPVWSHVTYPMTYSPRLHPASTRNGHYCTSSGCCTAVEHAFLHPEATCCRPAASIGPGNQPHPSCSSKEVSFLSAHRVIFPAHHHHGTQSRIDHRNEPFQARRGHRPLRRSTARQPHRRQPPCCIPGRAQ